MIRIDTLTGKLLDLKLTNEELQEERKSYPYNHVERENELIKYRVIPCGEGEDENGEIEIDDLPDNITDILVNHINNHKKGDLDKTDHKVLTINNFYCKEKNPSGGIFLSSLIELPGVRGSWGELEYKEDKMLFIDFRYWPEDKYSFTKGDGIFLTIEDRYNTIYIEYNRAIEYLDPKIDLDRLLECLKNKVM